MNYRLCNYFAFYDKFLRNKASNDKNYNCNLIDILLRNDV